MVARWVPLQRQPDSCSSFSDGLSGFGIGSSSAFTNESQHRVQHRASGSGCFSTVTRALSSLTTGTLAATTASGGRDKDGPLAVEIIHGEGQLVLLQLKLQFPDGIVDDKGVGGSI